MTDSSVSELLQAGGVLAFAGVVLYLLRELRPILKDLKTELFEMRITLAALLERERIRDDRRKRESMQPPIRGMPAPAAAAESWDGQTTDIKELIEKQRAAAKPRGERSPRKGTHHDEE